jgi:hypothetical protein
MRDDGLVALRGAAAGVDITRDEAATFFATSRWRGSL